MWENLVLICTLKKGLTVIFPGMELVGPKWRLLLGSIINMAYAVGYMLMTSIAYIWKDGINFELSCLLPNIVFVMLFL